LVSVEEKAQYAKMRIFNAVNGALKEIGETPFSKPEEVKAVVFLAVREKTTGALCFGNISNAHLFAAILDFLIDHGTISRTCAEAAYKAWMMLDSARKK
jgi:hypothetical protein